MYLPPTWFHMVFSYYLKAPGRRRTADKEGVVSMNIQLLQSFHPLTSSVTQMFPAFPELSSQYFTFKKDPLDVMGNQEGEF